MDSEAQEETIGSTRTVRRSARATAKVPAKTPAAAASLQESSMKGKRKAREPVEKSPEERLEFLLTNSKSKLTNVDISDVVSYENFLELPEDVQSRLCALLPPTAFSTYSASACWTHPDGPAKHGSDVQESEDRMEVDGTAQGNDVLRSPATLDPMLFSSSFFLSAAHTFQDHLYSTWLGKKASEDLAKFKEGARAGDVHADWKDEVWELEHQPVISKAQRKKLISADLTALAKHGLLQEGDVLAYKRAFPALNVVVEKDVLVEKVDMRTYVITIALSPGTQKELPPFLLVHGTEEQDEKMLIMEDIFDPVALERGVLDVDGRVRSADKYAQDLEMCGFTDASGGPTDEVKNMISVKAWKSFTVWRWQEHMREQKDIQITQERGGREKVATLFYLRGCCLNGQ